MEAGMGVGSVDKAGWGCSSRCTPFAGAVSPHQGSAHSLPMDLQQVHPVRGTWCEVGCVCGGQAAAPAGWGLASATAKASSCPAQGIGLVAGAPDPPPLSPGPDHHHVHLSEPQRHCGPWLPLHPQAPHHTLPAPEECGQSPRGHHSVQCGSCQLQPVPW